MKIGPKFKIAKRLGAPIFEKTQTQKFAISEARAGKTRQRRRGTTSDYKKQLIEKQKLRFTYGISEKQLRKYVAGAVSKSHQPIVLLMARLESRLDNVAYRLGLAKTRQMSRQMASHGHLLVNGRRLNIPSYEVKTGDIISVREGSRESVLFAGLSEQNEGGVVPAWLSFDIKKLSGEKKAEPTYEPTETLFDLELVLEYYSR